VWTWLGSRKSTKQEKCPKTGMKPHCPRHEVFGDAFLLFSINNF
jgi:hypothetical protein